MKKKVQADPQGGNAVTILFGREAAIARACNVASELTRAAKRLEDSSIEPGEFKALRNFIDSIWFARKGWSKERMARMILLELVDGQAQMRGCLLLSRALVMRKTDRPLSTDERQAIHGFERRQSKGKATKTDDVALRWGRTMRDWLLAESSSPPFDARGFTGQIVFSFEQEYPDYGARLRAVDGRLDEVIRAWNNRGAPPVGSEPQSRKWRSCADLFGAIQLKISPKSLQNDWHDWSTGGRIVRPKIWQ